MVGIVRKRFCPIFLAPPPNQTYQRSLKGSEELETVLSNYHTHPTPIHIH